jgi:secreted trypsin-like serine protease
VLSAFLFTGQSKAITTFGDPNDPMYVATPGGPFDGVARLVMQFGTAAFGCSGSLLSTGYHVLTAAHCVTDFTGADLPTATTARFLTTSGIYNIAVSEYIVFDQWDGDLFSGTDLALLRLATLAPGDAQRYDIYRGNAEEGADIEMAGWGLSGRGSTGATIPFGVRRHAANRYDVTGDFFVDVSERIAMGDFDNGTIVNDAFAYFGVVDRGRGVREGSVAPGDSGGPSFIGGKVAGVHSFGATIGCAPDILTPANLIGPAGCKLDSSFGEFFGDTRVSSFQGWIDSNIPEPSTYALMGSGLVVLGMLSRRRRSQS